MSAPTEPTPKTRFLPIRSKSNTLGRYELMRHPSKCYLVETNELYKYIEAPPTTIIRKTPALFYSSKAFNTIHETVFWDSRFESKPECKHMLFSPEFIERIDESGPFMGTILFVFYDETETKIRVQHISAFIYFPESAYLYIVDTSSHENKTLQNIIHSFQAFFNKNIDVYDVGSGIYQLYGIMPYLQKDESIGYCQAWAAGIMETLAPKLEDLNSKTIYGKFDIFKQMYEDLMTKPTFGRDYYNLLAMRSHGATRKGGVYQTKKRRYNRRKSYKKCKNVLIKNHV